MRGPDLLLQVVAEYGIDFAAFAMMSAKCADIEMCWRTGGTLLFAFIGRGWQKSAQINLGEVPIFVDLTEEADPILKL